MSLKRMLYKAFVLFLILMLVVFISPFIFGVEPETTIRIIQTVTIATIVSTVISIFLSRK